MGMFPWVKRAVIILKLYLIQEAFCLHVLLLTTILIIQVNYMNWYGGIEAGGTKFNCIIASDPDHILAEKRITTRAPEETLPEVVEFFNNVQNQQNVRLVSLGLGTFGPIDLNLSSPDYGKITSTPKLSWRNTDILGYFKNNLHLPVAFDTDVTAAALGEGKWGVAQGCTDFVYVTIGTGIGGGVIVDGKPVHGLLHPELGHMFIPHNIKEDPFPGNCPSHRDCLEGLANGPAIKARWGVPAESLPADHPAWKIEAKYLAYMLANIVLTCSPQKIILGGGVMKIPGLIESAREQLTSVLNGYVQSDRILEHVNEFVQLPGLGDRAGVLGSIALAQTIK
jgi:fructokinase